MPPAKCEAFNKFLNKNYKYYIDWCGSLFWIEVLDKDDEKINKIKNFILENNGYLTILKKSENFDFQDTLFTIDNTRLMISKGRSHSALSSIQKRYPFVFTGMSQNGF